MALGLNPAVQLPRCVTLVIHQLSPEEQNFSFLNCKHEKRMCVGAGGLPQGFGKLIDIRYPAPCQPEYQLCGSSKRVSSSGSRATVSMPWGAVTDWQS